MSQNLPSDFWMKYADLIDQMWGFSTSTTTLTYMELYTYAFFVFSIH